MTARQQQASREKRAGGTFRKREENPFRSTKQGSDEHLLFQRRFRREVFALIHNKKSAVLGVIPRRRFLLPVHSIPLFPLLYHRSRPAQIRKGGTRPARPSFNLMPAIPAGPLPPPQSCCPPAVQSPPSRIFAARRPRSSPSPAVPARTAASWARCSTRRSAGGGR